MTNIQALREKIAHLATSAKNMLAEKGSQTWTAEEQTTFDGYTNEIERLQAQIKSAEKLRELEADHQAIRTRGDEFGCGFQIHTTINTDCNMWKFRTEVANFCEHAMIKRFTLKTNARNAHELHKINIAFFEKRMKALVWRRRVDRDANVHVQK
jgi:hypothetical protein